MTFLLGWWMAVGGAQEASALLTVEVVDPGGFPVPSARVNVSGIDGDRSVIADDRGVATFLVPLGTYEVTVDRSRYAAEWWDLVTLDAEGLVVSTARPPLPRVTEEGIEPGWPTRLPVGQDPRLGAGPDEASSDLLTKDFLSRLPVGRSYAQAFDPRAPRPGVTETTHTLAEAPEMPIPATWVEALDRLVAATTPLDGPLPMVAVDGRLAYHPAMPAVPTTARDGLPGLR